MTYFFDFMKQLTKRSNLGILIYFVINIWIVAYFFSGGFENGNGMVAGIIIYGISLCLAISPLGEWILRLQTGCREITDPEVLERLQPLFQEVHEKAKRLNPSLPDDVKLFMNHEEQPNAFATGRKTICLTKGFLNYSDEEIKAVLAHEFGHLSHKDTDFILLIAVGNFIVSGIFLLMRIMVSIMGIMGLVNEDGRGGGTKLYFFTYLLDGFLAILMWLWTKLGIVLVMHSSRQNEFLADEFSFRCGYGSALITSLSSFGTEGRTGLWANLVSSHPDMKVRIEKLLALEDEEERGKVGMMKGENSIEVE